MKVPRVRVLIFIGLTCLFCACDYATNEPEDPNEFAITQVLGDSLYGGEALRLVVKDAGVNTLELSAFLGAIPAAITERNRDTLTIDIPRGAETSPIQLFKQDTILAAGDFTPVIFDQHVEDLTNQIVDLKRRDAYPGDTVLVVFDELPRNERPILITLDNRALSYFRQGSDTLRVPIPSDAATGDFRVFLFGRKMLQRPFTILGDPGVFLVENRLSRVLLDAKDIWATMVRTYKTATAEVTEAAGAVLNANAQVDVPSEATVSMRGDTIVINSERFESGLAWKVDVQLVPQGNRRFDGNIYCYRIENYGKWNARGVSFCTQLNSMQWRRVGGDYVLMSTGDEIKSTVTDLCFISYTTSGTLGTIDALNTYHGNINGESEVVLTLRP